MAMVEKMSRPIEFDEVNVMNKAVATFLSKGYEATTLVDLLKAMEVSKTSFYNSFGTKHDVFLASIDHYVANAAERYRQLLSGEEHVRFILSRALDNIIDDIIAGKGGRGCFLHNCLFEVLPVDELAHQHTQKGFDHIREIFIDFLKRGQARGQVGMDKDCAELADYIYMSIMGIYSVGRIYPDAERLRKMRDEVVAEVF